MNVYYPLLKLFWKFAEKCEKSRLANIRARGNVVVMKDLPYSADGLSEHMLDVYLPDDGGSEPLPVIISIHGGGWMYGAKENNLELCTTVAHNGFTVFNINYTLAPRASMGIMLDEIMTAFRFIGANAERFRGDMRRVFLLGDSAGAQLSLCAAAIVNSEKVRSVFDLGSVPFKVSALMLISPVCFLRRGLGPVAANHNISLYGDFEKLHRAHIDPAFFFENGAVCPAFITTSAGDSLGKKHAMRLAGMYREYGIRCVFDYASDRKLGHIYPMYSLDNEYTQGVLERMYTFFGEV